MTLPLNRLDTEKKFRLAYHQQAPKGLLRLFTESPSKRRDLTGDPEDVTSGFS